MRKNCIVHTDREINFICFDKNCEINKNLCVICIKHDHLGCDTNSIIEIVKLEKALNKIENKDILNKKIKEIIKFKAVIIKRAGEKIRKSIEDLNESNFNNIKKEIDYKEEEKIALIKKFYKIDYDNDKEEVELSFNFENNLKRFENIKDSQKGIFKTILKNLFETKFRGNIIDKFYFNDINRNSVINQLDSENIKILASDDNVEIFFDEIFSQDKLFKIIGKYTTEELENKFFGIGVLDKKYCNSKNYLEFCSGINIFDKKNFKGNCVFNQLQKDFEIFFSFNKEKNMFRIYNEKKELLDLNLEVDDYKEKIVALKLRNIELIFGRVN